MLVLLGVLLVVVGFALRFNPLLVVTVAGIVSALLAGMSPLHILDAFGNGFASSRSVSIAFVVLPVIGLLERLAKAAEEKPAVPPPQPGTPKGTPTPSVPDRVVWSQVWEPPDQDWQSASPSIHPGLDGRFRR